MTRAMILCAGLGTRLRPLTNHWPKPAMPFLGGPLLRYSVALLANAGVKELGINTFQLPEVMERVARAECERAGLTLTVSTEHPEIQGTGGGMRGLRTFLGGGDAVVLNGDVLFTLDVAAAVAAHRQSNADATMVLLPMPEGEKYNAVEVDEAGWVRRIAGVGPGGDKLVNWHFSGAHVLSPRVFDFMAPTGAEDINRDVYRRLLEAGGRIHAHRVVDRAVYWSDLGTLQRYLATQRDVLERWARGGPLGPQAEGLSQAALAAAGVRSSGPAWVSRQAVLGRDVRLGSNVAIGPGANVGEGAMLNRVAVLDGAVVPAGQLVEDAIIGPAGLVDAR